MDDLISRQVASDNFEKQIHEMFDHIWDCEIDHPAFQDTVGELMDAVIQCYHGLTSAQKTGKWIHERLASTTGGTYPIVRCSACMGDIPFEWPTKYCPHCGARMESKIHDCK